ncbi:protein pinocchio-like isoform X2 [Anopheles albimanus]|uniref:protein pinocchio-like isoform X2 n=1 Tax=Anopheles albimanus TaxID=7167 RepID=UPI001641D847|nr:protein pinocchio-like isoform X2 [Anopheles albimanus]
MKSYDNVSAAVATSVAVPRHIVTEWEDNVLFDADDPDFCSTTSVNRSIGGGPPSIVKLATQPPSSTVLPRSVTSYYGLNSAAVVSNFNHLMKVSSSAKLSAFSNSMSVASVQAPHLADLCSSLRTSLSMSSSLSDLVGSPSLGAVFDFHSSDAVLTIEELREQLGSCYTCGVSWTEDQVSLDCSECGGYSLERPCLICEGICGQLWKRDFTMSHACGKSRWQGVCSKFPAQMIQLQSSAPLSSCASFGSHHQLTAAVTSSANASSSVAPTAAAAATAAAANVASQQHFLQQELCARLEKLSANAHS